MLIFRRILIFLTLWLTFEIAVSWLATCQPGDYPQAAKYGYQERCDLFVGPVSLFFKWFATLWDANKIIAAFTGVLSISTIFLWLSTRDAALAGAKAAEIAEDTLIASNRPWISILPPAPKSGLTWDQRGARVDIGFAIKNVGKSPAFDIVVECLPFSLGPANYDIGETVRNFCAETRRRQLVRASTGQRGEVLFPDQSLTKDHGLLFQSDAIVPAPGATDFFAPVFVICVDYTSSVTNKRHTTGLAYMLLRPALGNMTRLPRISHALAQNQFGIAASPFGSFAD